MFLLFSRHKKVPDFKPIITGRLETTLDKLKANFGQQLSGHIYDVDITAFTGEFSGDLKIPTKIQETVRQVLDDYLKEDSEFYFQIDERVFGLFFKQASKTVAELKVQVIHNELCRAIQEIKRQKQVSNIREIPTNTAAAPASYPCQATQKAGTLTSDLSEKEMRDWANRAIVNMTTNRGYADFQADIRKLSEIIKVRYKPLWYYPNSLVSAYMVETTASFSEAQYEDKQSQEDLALLSAATRHLCVMNKRCEYALMVVPVMLHTICSKNTKELFNIYCRSITPELKRFLVLRVKGMDPETMSVPDWEAIKALTYHCRSIVLDVPQKRINPKHLPHLGFHAFGFDMRPYRLPEERMLEVMEDFASYYRGFKKDTFLLGISNLNLLEAAIELGYKYMSGPIVMPYADRPRHASYMKLDDIYRRPENLARMSDVGIVNTAGCQTTH